MDTNQASVILSQVRDNRLLFHNGLWGAEMCYMWASCEPGRGAGRVEGSMKDTLDRLIRLGLVAIQPGRGATDVPLVLTATGAEYLRTRRPHAA